jgi:hypothetical protein
MVLSVPQNVEASSDSMIVDWAASSGSMIVNWADPSDSMTVDWAAFTLSYSGERS